MRLHRLSMTAIGPFADRTELDLSRFGDSGLFLIEGPTGSGKSTVLDSITFALYGKLAQSTGAPERLKSHHAPPGTEPVVELIFETQSGLYRIRRTPSYERRKKRGAGSTTVNMTVKLWRLTSATDLTGGELLSNNLGDVEDEITHAVGLNHAQFVQTVLLPQGEFATFLRADTSVKRALLQRLFGTEIIARTQDRLIEGRRIAEQLRTAATEAVRRAGHGYAGAVGLSAELATELAELAEAGDSGGLATTLDRIEGTLRAAEQRAAQLHTTATGRRLQADTALARGRDLIRRRDTRDRLRVEHDRLAAATDRVEQARAELAGAERALRVAPSAQALADAIARSDAAQDEQARARGALADNLYSAEEPELREAAARRRTVVGELSGELRRERQLSALYREHSLVLSERASLALAIDEASEQLDRLPARRAELQQARELGTVAAGRLDGLIGERDRAQTRLQAAVQAAAAALEAAENQQLAREVFEAADRQRVRLEALRSGWRASIAGELGLALLSGDPCAVCGSLEHPRPARPAAGHVSQDQLISAEDELRRLTEDVESRRAQLSEQQSELIRLQLQAEQLTPALAETKLAKATTTLAAAEADAARLPAIDADLAGIELQLSRFTERMQAAARQEAGLAERATGLASTIEQDELAVHQARAGFETVAERVSSLTGEIEVLELAAAASAGAAAAVATAIRAGSAFQQALTDAGFAEQDDWLRCRRDSTALARLRARVREYDDQVAAVNAQLGTAELTDPQLDAASPDSFEEATLAEGVRLAAHIEDEAAQAHGAATVRLAAARTHAGLVGTAAADSAQVLADTAPAIRLGNLVAGLGENQLRMELTTYVLVRRFADIVSAANSQLARISEGRYRLEHTDARSGNSRSGLGLRVLDQHTGRARDPGTLSGGETFYVSLSLALGLADIVRAESGGVDLGTLFIDEGFGTLDADVLDQVIATLDALREGGRVVGVVSHVSELKLRIADRIRVRRRPDGSSELLATG
jgi:exonuclease SbcC